MKLLWSVCELHTKKPESIDVILISQNSGLSRWRICSWTKDQIVDYHKPVSNGMIADLGLYSESFPKFWYESHAEIKAHQPMRLIQHIFIQRKVAYLYKGTMVFQHILIQRNNGIYRWTWQSISIRQLGTFKSSLLLLLQYLPGIKAEIKAILQ
jgi:hypothetical protein